MRLRFRMYRQGLGDCLLLSFGPPASATHMLVDCGVLLGTKDAEKKITAVVKDIGESTGGALDIVVATHEHWDHLSGFVQAQKAFDELTFGQTWFAWTEDPQDPQASALRRAREARKAGLAAAVSRMNAMGLGAAAERTAGLLGFFGPGALGAGGGKTTADAMKYVLGRHASPRFLEPGTSFPLPGAKGVRVFVLGPPRDEAFIRKGGPSKRDPETYAALSALSSMPPAAMGGGGVLGPGTDELLFPFDGSMRISVDEARSRADPFFREWYGFEEADTPRAPAWRRVDGDWLGVSEELAIALDNDTNNTSLVLAIELERGGDVVLLVADAQVGNWKSWAAMEFTVTDGEGARTVTAADLLARTVLYKVGHHASHNATLRELGLERMTHPGLIAVVPVDEAMAQKKRWTMPYPPLFERLHERCSGRVLRLDTGEPDDAALARLTPAERKAFKAQTSVTEHSVEVVLTS